MKSIIVLVVLIGLLPAHMAFAQPIVFTGDKSHLAPLYPKHAMDDSVSGSAQIECVVQPDYTLKACVVLSESPKGYGFGKATIKLFETYTKVDPTDSHAPAIGEHHKVIYNWTLN